MITFLETINEVILINIIIEENTALRKFFRANKRFEALIRHSLIEELPQLIKERPYKIKTCGHYHYLNQTIYEYKISLDSNTSCRVAYIQHDNEIRIFFITNTIVKEQFLKLLAKQAGVNAQ